MTDNEIVKAWEKVLNNSDEPIGEHWMVFVTTQMAKETFDMLTRQKAEIERLQCSAKRHGKRVGSLIYHLEQAKSEAYREFAEKVKTKKFTHKNFGELVYVEDIDNTLKELTGEK